MCVSGDSFRRGRAARDSSAYRADITHMENMSSEKSASAFSNQVGWGDFLFTPRVDINYNGIRAANTTVNWGC